jgi:hypothetical protein
MERNVRLKQQMAAAAAAIVTACRDQQLVIAACLFFGRTSQQYHVGCCRGQHGRNEGRRITEQVSFDYFKFV